jgi:putative transposase
MRKKRSFVDGAAYHVTSRTNDKVRILERRLGKKIIETVIKEAREKYGFRLANFCIMPTHFHLLIIPGPGADLSQIMAWIKTQSAKRWNYIHGSTGHLWGNRFFERIIKTPEDFFRVMNYIDMNPVKAGLTDRVGDWKASGAYHIRNEIKGMLDYDDCIRSLYGERYLLLGYRR